MVVAEHSNDKLMAITKNAVTAAKKLGGEVSVLVAGTKCGPVSNVTCSLKSINLDIVLFYYIH